MTRYPKQNNLSARVEVCFNRDTTNIYTGTIIRDDAEEPYNTIILLDDGRVFLDTECQYRIVENSVKRVNDIGERIKMGRCSKSRETT